MKYFLFILFSIINLSLFGQTKLGFKVKINATTNFHNAYLYFPIPVDTTNSSRLDLPTALKCDTANIDSENYFYIDTSNFKNKIFYCIYNDNKSKIYNLTENSNLLQNINIVTPDNNYYDSLYKTKTCPLCHKSEFVVPLIFGKPGQKTIELAEKGKVKLAGCSKSNTSPKFYCKLDLIEF